MRPNEKERTMSNSEWKKSVGVMGRMLLAYALVLGQTAVAGQNSTNKGKAEPSQKSAQSSAQRQAAAAATPKAQIEESEGEPAESPTRSEKTISDASHQGIKVHGHWTIDVRNPDGTVVAHREFENTLGTLQNSLAAVLSRAGSVGFWKIELQDPNGTANQIGPCINSQAANRGVQCDIIEPGWASASGGALSFQFPTLTVSTAGSNSAQLVLSGTAVASVSDSIALVLTLLNVCAPTVAPSTPCATTQPVLFTVAALTNNFVNVTPGQTIAVTVTISFS
jgi:hypothetical protein